MAAWPGPSEVSLRTQPEAPLVSQGTDDDKPRSAGTPSESKQDGCSFHVGVRQTLWHQCSAMLRHVASDWASRVMPIAMMGLQGQAVVGSQAGSGVLQTVYLVQFGANAEIISGYLALMVPVSLAASLLAVSMLVRRSINYSWSFFVLGCTMSFLASAALTWPPSLHSEPAKQSDFLSHYFGVCFVISSVGSKLRDYPLGVARVLMLPVTELRAREKAYNTIFDVIVGNGLSGACLLMLMANPTFGTKVVFTLLQCASTIVSIAGAFVLMDSGDSDNAHSGPTSIATIAVSHDNHSGVVHEERTDGNLLLFDGSFARRAEENGMGSPTRQSAKSQEVTNSEPATNVSSSTMANMKTLVTHSGIWCIMLTELLVSWIFTLNSQAIGAIYWSSVVGVADNMRSAYIAIESVLGGGALGVIATLHVTRLYHSTDQVESKVTRTVALASVFASLTLALFGTTPVGAILGMVALYQYHFISPWTNIEFLSLVDSMRAATANDNHLFYTFFFKDIASTLLSNIRNLGLLWLLAQTGFHEPDCNLQCATDVNYEDCVNHCHTDAHADVPSLTVLLVKSLYVVVTPCSYLLACTIMYKWRGNTLCYSS